MLTITVVLQTYKRKIVLNIAWNYEFQTAKEKEENDIYRLLFFILLGIYSISMGLVTAYAYNVRFRTFVNSVIESLRSCVASDRSSSPSCGQPSTLSNGHVARNSPALTAHPNPYSQPNALPRNIYQNSVSNPNRQDGDGLSHSGRSDRDSRQRRVGNIPDQLPAQSSVMIHRVPGTPVQQLTKSKSRTASSASSSRLGEEAALLMTAVSSEHTLSNNTADSVTYAKRFNNVGDHSQRNNFSNPPVASNSYRALNVVVSNDTGYNTDACS